MGAYKLAPGAIVMGYRSPEMAGRVPAIKSRPATSSWTAGLVKMHEIWQNLAEALAGRPVPVYYGDMPAQLRDANAYYMDDTIVFRTDLVERGDDELLWVFIHEAVHAANNDTATLELPHNRRPEELIASERADYWLGIVDRIVGEQNSHQKAWYKAIALLDYLRDSGLA